MVRHPAAACSAALLLWHCAAVYGLLHIELHGNDEVGDGSAARPFATWAGCQRYLAGGAPHRHSHHPAGPPEFRFGPGVHSIIGTGGLRFDGPGHAGTVVSGAGKGATHLTGGIPISAWKATDKTWPPTVDGGGGGSHVVPVWEAAIPKGAQPFRQLFVQSQQVAPSSSPPGAPLAVSFARRLTARSEVMHYSHTNMEDPKHSIVYLDGQVLPEYHNQQDVLVTMYHCWTATTHHISTISSRNNTLTLLLAPHVDIPRCEHASGKRFYIKDAIEYLTPGEFYVDGAAGVVSYAPLPGEDLASFVAYAPQLAVLADIRNTTGVAIRDLSLVHGTADMRGFFVGDPDGQSASNLKSASVAVNFAADVSLTSIEVAHTGTYGVGFNESCVGVTLTNSSVHDVGAGAVRIGVPQKTRTGARATSFVKVVDCEMYDGGQSNTIL